MKIKLTNNEPLQLDSTTNGVTKSVDLARDLLTTSDISEWAMSSTKPTYNGGEVNYTGTTGSIVTTNTTLNTAVQALDTAVNNRLKYVLLSQAEYDSLTTKDSGTLYLIGGAKYTITLTGTAVSAISDITVNGESKTTSDFPMEVNEGSSLSFKCYVNGSASVVMGGTDITSSVQTMQNGKYIYDITNITGDIVVTVSTSMGGGGND